VRVLRESCNRLNLNVLWQRKQLNNKLKNITKVSNLYDVAPVPVVEPAGGQGGATAPAPAFCRRQSKVASQAKGSFAVGGGEGEGEEGLAGLSQRVGHLQASVDRLLQVKLVE
jgi:hypothetical protein